MEKTEINQFGLPNIVIPAELLFNSKITWREKVLFGFIKNLTANKKGCCWASNAYLAKLMNVRADTISSSVNRLERNGYLNLEYLRLPNGNQSREIYIDNSYKNQYESLLREVFSKLEKPTPIKKPGRPSQNPLGENPNTSRGKSKYPSGKSQSKLGKDLGEDLKDSFSDPPGSESKRVLKRTTLPKKDGVVPIKERNKEFLPLANDLSKIIQTQKNIKHTSTQIRKWTDEIRKLVEGNGVTHERIKKALNWYADNIGGQYIPEIESGASLRNKFIRLEDAMKRGNGKSPKKHNPSMSAVTNPNKYADKVVVI